MWKRFSCVVVNKKFSLTHVLKSKISGGSRIPREVSRMSSTVDVGPFLQNVRDNYHIEYGRFLSNHAAHGIIALQRLGASGEKIQAFVDWYKKKLDSKQEAIYQREFLQEGEELSDVSKIPIGSRTKFYPILDLIEKEIEGNGGDYKKSISTHFPKVSDGLEASLLHALIQLGYGVAADCKKTVAEGIAYMYHSYVSAYLGDPETDRSRGIGNFGRGTQEPLDVLKQVREDTELKNVIEEYFKTEDIQSRDIGALQQKIAAAFITSSKKLQEYVDMIKFPAEVDVDNVDVEALCTWIIDLSFVVYCTTEVKNDFAILHGVTGAWCLKQVLPFIADRPQEVLRAARTFLINLVVVYLARRADRLDPGELEGYPAQADQDYWEKVMAEQAERVCDEHFYKLVQVAHDMWKINPKQTSLYLCAVRHCMDNPMYLTDSVLYTQDERKV